MTSANEVTEKLLAAVRAVPGLKPAVPAVQPVTSWIPWDWEGLAVDLDEDLVRIQLIATRLPLPPLLERAAEAVRPALAGTPWEGARLRLEVTELDGSALTSG
ncbi:hypothetical protein [Amycolatopsis anabasis]|uniref:hypothetical protein n=1 Tax=Amycolatopsis anabasis TaxID=1840409 RepID=UPI00131C3D82|nr:hypothetical protein [Amycolatopsis anabasis]